jgi:hypothetical protein
MYKLLIINNCAFFDWSISLAESLTITGAIIAFIVALSQYNKAQKWKRTEFTLTYLSQYREILRDVNVRRGMLMLDWNRIEIPLQADEIKDKSNFLFTDDIFKRALRSHFGMSETDGFSKEETFIRLIMDEFLEKLGAFYPFIHSGFMKKDDMPGNIIYWIDIIGNKKNRCKDEETRKQLWEYIVTYKFTDLEKLCNEFGYKIR